MEADWEVEMGPDTPVIYTLWDGWVDLRAAPELIGRITEAKDFPSLADALLRLNAPESGLWTAKCDLWMADEGDPDEMEATEAEVAFGLACYIDVLPRDELVFPHLNAAEVWVRGVVDRLRRVPCRCCRADLVIRQALAGQMDGVGVTAYVAGCGAEERSAAIVLGDALGVLVQAMTTGPAERGLTRNEVSDTIRIERASSSTG